MRRALGSSLSIFSVSPYGDDLADHVHAEDCAGVISDNDSGVRPEKPFTLFELGAYIAAVAVALLIGHLGVSFVIWLSDLSFAWRNP